MASDHGFWNLLTGDEQRVLARLGLDKKYPPGTTMCVEGDSTTQVFILLDGWVKILSAADDGRENVLALCGGGDIAGEIAGDTTGHRNATMRSIDNVRALVMGHDQFSSFLESHPRAGRVYRRVMAGRWSEAGLMLRRRPVTSGAQRLAGVLLDLAGRHGSRVGGSIEVALPLSQEELASLAGTSRATVTRALGNGRERGFIRTGQRRITIINPRGLRQIAGPGKVFHDTDSGPR
jgi:CRP/FNR family transcriptional regulator, cyclic AMP receptor protein